MRCPALFLLLLCGAGHAAVADVRVMDTIDARAVPPVAEATHTLRLHLHAFHGSLWRADAILASAGDAAPLLAQCGIAMAQASLVVLDAPRRFRSYSTPAARELLREFSAEKPAVFFVDETLNRPAYDAETIGLGNAGGRPELAHTIWVAYGARDLPLVLAHELVHLLSNSGEHSTEPLNLMREDTAPENTRLTGAQCARVRANGVAQQLLDTR